MMKNRLEFELPYYDYIGNNMWEKFTPVVEINVYGDKVEEKLLVELDKDIEKEYKSMVVYYADCAHLVELLSPALRKFVYWDGIEPKKQSFLNALSERVYRTLNNYPEIKKFSIKLDYGKNDTWYNEQEIVFDFF